MAMLSLDYPMEHEIHLGIIRMQIKGESGPVSCLVS